GTITVVELLDRNTWTPPAGAGAVNVTVPVETCPVVTVGGLKNSSFRSGGGGVIVSAACCEMAPAVAVMITLHPDPHCCVVTGRVVTEKVVLELPAGTVTVAA